MFEEELIPKYFPRRKVRGDMRRGWAQWFRGTGSSSTGTNPLGGGLLH